MLSILGTILLINAIFLSAIGFFRPKLFNRQDILLIVTFFICGGIFFSQGRIYDQLPQIILMLLTAPAVFYTFENVRLRNRKMRE